MKLLSLLRVKVKLSVSAPSSPEKSHDIKLETQNT